MGKLIAFFKHHISEDGYAIKARSGVIRYMATYQDKFVTAATPEELCEKYHFSAGTKFKTFTFIPSMFEDNPIGMKADPDYVLNLELQSEHEKARLKYGNWKVRKQGQDVQARMVPLDRSKGCAADHQDGRWL